MNNFEKLKSMSAEELAEWLDKHGQFDNSPWMLWWDRNYCKNCEDIICKSSDDSRHFPCAYCEIYDKCRYFQDQEDVPDNKEIIKMWLKSEVDNG